MRTYNKITVNSAADPVWKVLADEFNHNDLWMAQVFKTRDTSNGEAPELDARVCELTPTLDGIRTHEEIVFYDKENYVLKFTVQINNGGKLPVKHNIATVHLTPQGDKTLVEWATTPALKPLGYIMYPLLKKGIQKSFKEVLEELKFYVENGKPHPRKVEAMKLVKQ